MREMKYNRQRIIDALRLPTDSVCGDMVVCITGMGSVFIENYRGILKYCEDGVILQGKRNKIAVKGCCLKISYYTNESMRITGKISNISFLENGETCC